MGIRPNLPTIVSFLLLCWRIISCINGWQYENRTKTLQFFVKSFIIFRLFTVAQTFTKFARACYYRHIRIICPLGSYINIDAAFWGRRNKHHCTYISMKHPCGVKDISTITQAIKNKCDYRGYCDLYASPTKPYLNDPCPTVNKYLEVNFTCVKGKACGRLLMIK